VESLACATPDTAAFVRAREEYGGEQERFSLFLYARLGDGRVRARMFAPLSRVPEDPATGSASGALGGLLASLDDGNDFRLTIEQGVEMGRPSLIQVHVTTHDGRQAISIAGNCVPVLSGTITL
jgi:trans-2,3-dihydro-3-hydroxyanthranilate isomerase